jgi:hypothetical protein
MLSVMLMMLLAVSNMQEETRLLEMELMTQVV